MAIANAFNRNGGTSSENANVKVQTVAFINVSTLTINHTFSNFPNVIILDSNGNLVHAEVRYNSSTQILINFAVALSGSVILR